MYEIALLFFAVDSLSLYWHTLFCILDTNITFLGLNNDDIISSSVGPKYDQMTIIYRSSKY